MPDRYNGKPLTVAGVEGMDDAEQSLAIARTGRSRRCRQMPSQRPGSDRSSGNASITSVALA
jgi:hypothetical protein